MVPSSSTIARWRHLVRVLVRLAGVPLVIFGGIVLIQAILRTVISILEGGVFTFFYLAYANVTPVLIVASGVILILFDKWLAALIVPMPAKGCPNCGYWIGARELPACPECGIDLTERGS